MSCAPAFAYASSFNGDVAAWDVSRVASMYGSTCGGRVVVVVCEVVCGGVVVEGVAMGWGSVRGWQRKERVDVEEKRGGMVGCVVLWWCVGEGLKEGRAWLCEW